MDSSRVKKTSSAPSKVRKLRKGGGSFSGRVDLGAGSPTRYSGTSARLDLTIPFGPSRVDKDSPSITASVNRQQGLGGTDKGVPSVFVSGKYKYNFK